MTAKTDSKQRMIRKSLYDRKAAREAKSLGRDSVLQNITSQPWSMDVNEHWSRFRDEMQESVKKHFPNQKRTRRQLYFSDACWNLVCQRKELRQLQRQHQRDDDHQLLRSCFQAWRSKQQQNTQPRSHVDKRMRQM